MPLTALQLIYNQTVLLQGLQQIIPFLEGPTLIYHDGTDEISITSKMIAQTLPLVLAKVPEHPFSDNLQPIRSTILLVKSPEPMVSVLRIWPLWKARSRVVLILRKSSDPRQWIEILWKRTRAADILVLIVADTPEFYTWFPYKINECSNVTTIVRLNSTNLFPEKITPPLNNCPLIAVTTALTPFVVNDTHGIETRIFLDLAEKLHMKGMFRPLPLGSYVWTVFDQNYKPYSGLKLLFDNEVDALFSQMAMSMITAPFAEFLMTHTTEEYLFFVPGPVEAPRATAIYKAFAPLAWVFVGIASIIIYATMTAIPLIETGQLQPSLLHTIAIILNIPTNFPPSKTLLIFAIACYFYSMHITTAYTTSFIVFLSDVPRERPMKSLQDIVDSGLKAQMHSSFRTTIDALSSSPLMNALNQPSRAIFTPRLNLTMVAEGKVVVLGPKITYKSMLRQDMYYDEFDHSRVLLIYPPIYYTFLSIYTSKGHPLHQLLNKYIIRLIEGGFPERYGDEVEKPPRPRQRNLKPFGVKNVEGPFVLLLSLLSLCFIAWISEWIYYLIINIKKEKQRGSLQPPRNQIRYSWIYRQMWKMIRKD